MKQKHMGSNFEDFLEAEGILEECGAAAIKFQLAHELEAFMKHEHLTQVEIAKALKTSRPAVTRLLDPNNTSITLITMSKVARLLGKKLNMSLQEQPANARI